MISKRLNIAKSENSIPTWAIPFPKEGRSMFIDNGTPIEVAVPAGCNVAVFEYNSGPKVIVNEGSGASNLPTLGAVLSSDSRMNPSAAWVTPGTSLWFQTLNSGGDVLTIGFYSNEENIS
jgi:hypothetical protein